MCVVTDVKFAENHQEGSVGQTLNTTGSGWKGYTQKSVFVPKPVRTFILICYNEVRI